MIHIKLLSVRLLILLLLYFICRILFLFFNWNLFVYDSVSDVFPAFFYGILFDLSAIVYVNMLFIFLHIIPFNMRAHRYYQSGLEYLFYISNSAALLLNFIDTAYFRHSLQRSGSEIIKMFNETKNISPAYIIDYWYILLLFLLSIFFMVYLYKKTRISGFHNFSKGNIIPNSLIFVIIIPLCILLARGGFYHKPLNSQDAAKFVDTRQIALTLNSPFHFIRTINKKVLTEKTYFNKEELNLLYLPVFEKKGNLNPKGENVVILILESFGKEYFGYFNEYEGYTPFLDSLFQHSTVFRNSYANGMRSVDGIPAILAGMPSWMPNAYIGSAYQTNQLHSLGKILKDHAYQSSFFHGGHNGTMSFDAFLKISGFGNYYGMNEYPDTDKEYDGNWGIYDEPYLQYVAKQLNSKQSPFLAAIFTLSSHHPYSIPDKYKNTFNKSKLPIHNSIAYTDYSLSEFFKTIKKTDWYQNTLFVITADHTGESENAFYRTPSGQYAVPIAFFHPQKKIETDTGKVIQHIDIMPGLLDYLDITGTYFAFGKSVFDIDTSYNRAIQYLYGGVYQIIYDHYVMHYSQGKQTALFDLKNDPLYTHNHIGAHPEIEKKMLDKLRAVIQTYNESMIRNKLVY